MARDVYVIEGIFTFEGSAQVAGQPLELEDEDVEILSVDTTAGTPYTEQERVVEQPLSLSEDLIETVEESSTMDSFIEPLQDQDIEMEDPNLPIGDTSFESFMDDLYEYAMIAVEPANISEVRAS